MRSRVGVCIAELLVIFLLCSCGAKKDTVLYVSPDGNDTWSGTMADPADNGSDGPFATLERARDAVRELKKNDSLPDGGISIIVRGGVYEIEEALTLEAQDSGSEMSPIVWRASSGETVRLVGGKFVPSFSPLTDAAMLERFDPSAREHIVVADCKALGIADYGSVNPASGNRIELYLKGQFMQIARYPNEGWLNVADVPQSGPKMINKGLDRDKSAVPRGRHYGRFAYDGDHPKEWRDVSNLWVHGYWTWDWSDQYLKVEKIDIAKREITPVEPHHTYGYTKGQRYYFLNVLEELDSPGEWFIDETSGLLYFWPPEPVGEGDALISVLTGPMIALDSVANVDIRGLFFEAGRGNAIVMNDCANVVIKGCGFRNFGETVVTITGGADCGVQSCDIYDTAAGGIFIEAGDRATLTSANCFADNNHIHHFAQRKKTYRGAVHLIGVGNRASHNLVHDAPHLAIMLPTSRFGNDHVVEYNEIHNVALETGDVGAIYICARDYSMRGSIVRYNYLHDTYGPGEQGAMAVYLDDFTSGTHVYGNVFNKAGRAILAGGGRDNIIENNVFFDCEPSIHVDARGTGWAKYYFGDGSRFQKLLDAVNYKEPPFSERYPEILTVMDDEPAIPKNTVVERNISTGGRFLDLYDGIGLDVVRVTGNVVGDSVLMKRRFHGKDDRNYMMDNDEDRAIIEDEGNVVTGDIPSFDELRTGSGASVLPEGFEDIPYGDIGLVADEYRTEIPKP